MNLWEILVLGVVRLTLDVNYDFLHDLSNEHSALRGILGVKRGQFIEEKYYNHQTIIDNVSLLDEDLIKEINAIVVKAGHQEIKKKEGASADEKVELAIKVDSYVVETKVHFPTDLNLLWDCSRKCFDMIDQLIEKSGIKIKGLREIKS